MSCKWEPYSMYPFVLGLFFEGGGAWLFSLTTVLLRFINVVAPISNLLLFTVEYSIMWCTTIYLPIYQLMCIWVASSLQQL